MICRSVVALVFIIGLCLAPLTVKAQAAQGTAVQPPISRTLDQGWWVRLAPGDASATTHPGAERWIPASVPGSVQTDLTAAGLLDDPWVGDNERTAQWVGLSNWQYRTTFTVDAATLARGNLDLVFEGLDTLATVRINGVEALKADNMFRSWRVAAKSLLKPGDNVIEVDLASPIKALQPMVLALPQSLPGSYDSAFGDEPAGRQTAGYVRKANYQYGWDWAPRVVTLGLWKPVRLEAYDGVRLVGFHAAQVHLDDDVAALDATAEVWSDATRTIDVRVDVTGPDGSAQTQTRRVELFVGLNPVVLPVRIEKPRRWWPVGYGDPDLYAVTATLSQDGRELGRDENHIGLRTTELRRDPDQWGRSFELVVNGVPIFAKGANMVPFDSFPSRVTSKDMDRVLKAAVDANMNVVRVWGGGVYPDDAFYDTADRLGLMVWQDFMFGGALVPGDPVFRETTRLEAVEQVRRLRDHPSVVLWVGNNEVQSSWETWDDRKGFKAAVTPEERDAVVVAMTRMFDQTLRSAVELNAPGTPYSNGSPSTDFGGADNEMTDGDVHYWKVWVGLPIEDYLKITPRFMAEFGLQSMPDMHSLARFVDPQVLASTPVQLVGNGYDRGGGNGRLLSYVRANYGEPRSFADYVYLSQAVQADGMELAVTHLRASRPQSMGTLYWTLNDAWPGQINRLWTGAAWGSIDHYGRWKALHYHARRFYAPVMIGAQRSEGVTTLSLISDRRVAFGAHWRFRVMDRDGTVLSDRSADVSATPLSATRLAAFTDAELLGAADPARTFALAELIVDGAVVSRGFVYFALPKALALTDPGLETHVAAGPNGAYVLTVSAKALARAVWIDLGDLDATLSDNAFDLAPGQTATVTVASTASLQAVRAALSVRSLFGAADPLATIAAVADKPAA